MATKKKSSKKPVKAAKKTVKKKAKKTTKKAAAKKTTKKAPNKGGRPKFEITPEVLAKAEKLAAQGLALYQIADVLGICYQTLNEKKKEFSEFSDAIRIGQSKGIATATSALFKEAAGGDVPALKYYLNNRDNENWKEKREVSGTVVHKYEHLEDDELDEELARLDAA